MLSGSGRVALFFSAVMVEITNDTEFIPPLVLATFVAAIVGNLFNREFTHPPPRGHFLSCRCA